MSATLQHLQELPLSRQALVARGRQGLSSAWSGLQQSAASLFDHCKPKPAIAAALLLAGSVFGSPAQAAIVQLNLSGNSFSGYIFFDTDSFNTHIDDSRLLRYYGTSYINTPFSGSNSPVHTTNPTNPYTNQPVQNNASLSYLIGDLFLESSCENSLCRYYIELNNRDGSFAIANSPDRPQSSAANMIDGSYPETMIWFDYYTDPSLPSVFSEVGTMKLPAVIAPPASPVPEPATWALMIGGFGMVGGAARYKRRKTTTIYA